RKVWRFAASGRLGLRPALRTGANGGRPVVTENGNLLLDCTPDEPLRGGAAARALQAALLAIPGVGGTGLFLGTAGRVLVGYGTDASGFSAERMVPARRAPEVPAPASPLGRGVFWSAGSRPSGALRSRATVVHDRGRGMSDP